MLDKLGLTDDLVEAGRQIAATMTEMFAGLPPEHEFFEQFSFIDANELPEFAAILTEAEKGGVGALDQEQRDKLLSLPFKLIAARHRLGVLDDAMQQRLLEARRAFREDLPEEARGQIEFFDPARYNAAASLQDNILFGKIAYGEADPSCAYAIWARCSCPLICSAVIVSGSTTVSTAGLVCPLARASARDRPPCWRPICDPQRGDRRAGAPARAKATAGLRQEMAGRGLIWVLHQTARNFDRVLVMSGGRCRNRRAFEGLDLDR